jgi:hypothetical protein
MPIVLVATEAGCRVFSETGEKTLELAGRKVGPLKLKGDGACLAIVDDNQVWKRSAEGTWSEIAIVEIGLQSIMFCGDTIFCGGMDEAAIIRIPQNGPPERLRSFENVSGRNEWFAGGRHREQQTGRLRRWQGQLPLARLRACQPQAHHEPAR